MPLAEDLKKAEKFLGDRKYSEATELLNSALKISPTSHKALLLMTQCLMRQKMTDLALESSEDLIENAFSHGKQVEIYEACKVKGMFHFRVKEFDEAFKWIVIGLQYNSSKDNEGPIFKEMVIRKLTQNGETDMDTKEKEILASWVPPKTITKTTPVVPTKSIPAALPTPANVPVVSKAQVMRHDWYDSNDTITVSIYIKKIDPDSVVSQINAKSVSVTFKDHNGFEYKWEESLLSHEISTTKSAFRVFGTKLEYTLVKIDGNIHWQQLTDADNVQTTIAPEPTTTSFGKKIDWSAVEGGEDEEEDTQDTDGFFRKLYAGADEDSRRAMMKSFSESQGTSLSMNWGEVGSEQWKPVED